MPGLERRLKAELSGDVRFDRFTRGRYATDASHYQVMPVGVVAPRTIEEADRAIGIARAEGATVLARGGGTSQAGQTVGPSLVVDCSKYLTRILDLDVKHRRCTVEPGIVLDDLNRQLKPHGLWFPVDISTASRATIGGMAGNNSCGGRSHALRHHARQCAVDRGDTRRRHARPFRPDRRQPQRCAGAVAPAGQRPAGDRRARGGRDRGALSESAAPGRRLQSRRAGAGQKRHQSCPRAGGRRGHARLLHAYRTEAVAAARPARGRRGALRQLLRSDERGAVDRAPGADRRSS